ncbi:MAG: hypothetical protein CMO82_07430 [Winogradskyella sp.]|nr:hypothetical protein [Winogradskyella sp.]|tara:strand:- start:74 stop:643 length:570 start_codon:yes stop_codon:yes gene_type:complete
MRVYSIISGFILLLLFNCAATSEVVYDYNLDVDFNQYDTYVLCIEDFTVEHLNYPQLDNDLVRQTIGDAVALEMENKAHKTNVLNPQLQAGFRIIISEETVAFENCEHSKHLEYWESCTIHEETYEEETLIVYVADFETNKVLWHASVLCELNKPDKKLTPYINGLVKDLFETYPKTQVGRNPDEQKEL